MKKIEETTGKDSGGRGPYALEKKRMNSFAAALCLLGMGLGVNLEETWAGMRKNPDDTGRSVDVGQPSVDAHKVKGMSQPSADVHKVKDVKQPSVDIDKSGVVKQPSVDFIKLDTATESSVEHDKRVGGVKEPPIQNPAVNRVKPVPATKVE